MGRWSAQHRKTAIWGWLGFVIDRKSVADRAGPDLGATIAKVQSNLTLPVIQELNYRVDIRKQSPAVVARQYLTSLGYVQ
jgi:glycine betaine/choline ABC-type transport system substrate-binding protein